MTLLETLEDYMSLSAQTSPFMSILLYPSVPG